jgi:ethanolamine utilization protein EutN
MQLGLIRGHATATVKHDSIRGSRMAIVQPIAADGTSPNGDPVIVIDRFGSARGDTVMITSDGELVRKTLHSNTTPVRWSVLGIQD